MRPCLDCGRPAKGSRCPDCARAKDRARDRRPRYEDEKRRRAAVREWRDAHGDVCPGWERDAHYSDDLTADHVVPLSRGGDPLGPLQVLCRSCNARKGAR